MSQPESALRRGAEVVVGDGLWMGLVVSEQPYGGLWTVMRGHDGVQFPIEAKDLTVIGYQERPARVQAP